MNMCEAEAKKIKDIEVFLNRKDRRSKTWRYKIQSANKAIKDVKESREGEK